MANKITWADKVGLNPRKTRINQVQDRDMNEIKEMHNLDSDRIDALIVAGAITYQTLTDLNAVSPVPAEGTPAKVANDTNPLNNGYYSVVSGVWVKDADLSSPDLVVGTSGLDVNIGSFVLHIDDADVTFPSTDVTLPANSTKYLCYDLIDYSVHYLERNITDGVIWVGKVTTDGTDVTNIEQITPVLPLDKIGGFNEKLNNSLKEVKVAVLADSLGTVTGGGVSFPDQLFDVANSGLGYNVPSIGSVTLDNYSSGGQTSHYGQMWTAKGVRSNASFSGNTAVSYNNITQTDQFTFDNFKPLLNSPLYRNDYDLVIVLYGANGGTYNLAYYENIIKNLRDNGIDVIICNCHQRSDNATFQYDEGYVMKSMSERYNCAFVDSWSFLREAIDDGVTVFDDVIHLLEVGKSLGYALPIRSVINDKKLPRNVSNYSIDRIIKNQDQLNLSANFPNDMEYDCHPGTNTGTFVSSAVDDYLNPSMQFGGLASSASIISLNVGEKVKFSHSHACAFDVVYDKTMIGDFTVKQTGTGASTLTFSQAAYAGSAAGIFEGHQISSFTDITSNLLSNRAVEIECTSGTARIYGIIWHVYKNRNISLDNIRTVGTWAEEESTYGHPRSIYTDTVDDSFSFDFYGSGCQVLFLKRSSSGVVDIYLNGELYLEDLDLYSTSNILNGVYISDAQDDYYDIPQKMNTVSVHLKSISASATPNTPASKNRRLAVLKVTEFDRM